MNETPPQRPSIQDQQDVYGGDLLSWKGPNKPLYDFGMEEFKTLVKISILLGIFFVLIQKFVLVMVLVALLFLIYTVVKAPVEYIVTQVKSTGIFSDGKLYLWENIVGFWFARKGSDVVLYVDTTLRFPGRLTFFLPNEEFLLKVYQLFIAYKPYRVYTQAQSWYQRVVDGTYIDIFDWIQENHPELITQGFKEALERKSSAK